MMAFLDSSAIYALLDADDAGHGRVSSVLAAVAPGTRLLTHQYAVVESVALAQRRLGVAAVRDLVRLLDVVDVVPVDRALHDRAVTALLAAGRRRVSLVDWTSFEFMRERGIRMAIALDADFIDQGFEVVPA
jgi:predicted nucleic acid-binding protein